jgi:predicted CoA-binding protein
MGKMLVLGATENPDRYGFKAVKALLRNDYEVVPVGFRSGFIKDVEILTGMPAVEDVDTILIYMGARKQLEFYDYIQDLKPRRVIFNPGAENPELQEILKEKGIKVVKDCALIMINTDSF